VKKLKLNKESAKKIREKGICGYHEGREIHDPVGIMLPAELRGEETMEMKLARILRVSEARRRAESSIESVEDAHDFGPDDFDPENTPTGYQLMASEMPQEPEARPNTIDPMVSPPIEPKPAETGDKSNTPDFEATAGVSGSSEAPKAPTSQ
jgi:hypothetical protein